MANPGQRLTTLVVTFVMVAVMIGVGALLVGAGGCLAPSRDRDLLAHHVECGPTVLTFAPDNQQRFRLANGGLFLVKTNNGQTEIQQLKTDLSTVQFTAEGLKALAKTNPNVGRFLATARKAKG